MKKCVIVYNPHCGLDWSGSKHLNNLGHIFNKYGYKYEIIETKCPNDATNILQNLKTVDLVIIAGGDGTLNEAIQGNLKRKNKLLLAQLPTGTQNDVAHMYGFTNNINENLELILKGVVKNIDVCLLNERPFIYVACLGAYTDVAYATPRKLKAKYGRLAYVLYGIKQLHQSLHNYDIEYEIEGKSYEGQYSFIFITNSNHVAGVKNIYEDVKLDDNKFEVLMCNIKNKLDILKALYYLKRRNIEDLPEFTYYKTNNIIIKFKDIPESSWDIDGDEYKHNTFLFNISITKEINMLVPNKNIIKLFENK